MPTFVYEGDRGVTFEIGPFSPCRTLWSGERRHLPVGLHVFRRGAGRYSAATMFEGPKAGTPFAMAGGFDLAGRSLREVETELIRVNLDLMEGNRAKTAQVLGMGERTLYRKIKEYGL